MLSYNEVVTSVHVGKHSAYMNVAELLNMTDNSVISPAKYQNTVSRISVSRI